jgi:hypothetical protein
MTPKLLMVHFEVGHSFAGLAAPTVPFQYGSTKLFILFTFQASRPSLLDHHRRLRTRAGVVQDLHHRKR